MKKTLILSFIIINCFITINVFGQFYNGHQMVFGKNRVQYNDFYWSFYRHEKFDTYFNQDGEAIARFTSKNASTEILKLEEKLNHKLDKILIFLVYNKFSDFKQSNIGLVTGKEDYNTGGVTKIRNNKVSLYFQGDHQEYLKQMREVIAETIVMEMLYGNGLSENFANSSIIKLPEWYIKGLTSYLSEEWSTEIENRVKDGVVNNRFKKFNRLTGEDAMYAGHSFWKYINDYYGNTVISDIIYLTRANKSINTAIYKVLGLHFKDIVNQWLEYYNEYFSEDNFIANDTIPKLIPLKKNKPTIYYNQVKLSPNGDQLAYVSNEMGQIKVWIYSSDTDKSKKIFKYGHKIKQINDFTYPVIEWHPSGKFLTIITEKNGGLSLLQYILKNEEITHRNLLYFDKILGFSYSDDGSKIVFSAIKNSLTDIYVFDIASSTSDQITRDLADDFHPRFIENSKKIIFTSNRISDTLNSDKNNFSQQFDLFIYDFNNSDPILSRLTNTQYQLEVSPFEMAKKEYYYLNNKNGINNLFYGKYDSTISFIDTSIHYNYFLKEKPITNLSRNISEHHINKNNNTYSYAKFSNGKYSIYKNDLDKNFPSNNIKLQNTHYQNVIDNNNALKDSIKYNLKLSPQIDSLRIHSKEDNYVDINHYEFEIEKSYFSYKYDNIIASNLKSHKSMPKIQVYQRTFYTDHVVSQVDFGFINSAYQAFTGGAVYFTPGLNALIKFGAFDLLEDYKIIAGVRFSADFNSNEYLISLENLKKKVDEQYIYHRQSFENTTENFVSKTQTNQVLYIRTIPFSQVTALKGTLSARQDKQIYMSTNRTSLQTPNNNLYWGGIKLDFIFDNTISKGTNLYNGTRFKIFGEYFNQINKSKTDLFVVGADFRHYQKIHRDLIFASRFAVSTSFGHSKLIYYLGGVDNWTNFSQQTPTFIPLNEIPIDENENYSYQAVATNLRGFPQNIRNGNSFALINTELRLPVVKYFSNYPINSSFWSNLQIISFFDIGTAWSGLSPYSGENAYDKEEYGAGPVVITIDTERDPIVAGYGVGFRLMIFNYFVRFDWAWGIENQQTTPRIFYFSLGLDF